MKPPLRLAGLLFLFLAVNSGWAGTVLPVAPAADGAYSITAKATHKFTRNTDKLKEQAMQAAEEFCAKDGKTLKVLSVKEDKKQYLVGDFAQVILTFKALAAGEAEAVSATAATPAAAKTMTTDELAAELTKLDDLRKKGLLTDAEFDALKQKLLNRF